MWTWIVNAFTAFFGNSQLPFVLAVLIAVLAFGDIWSDKNRSAARKLKYVVIALTVILLIAQKVGESAASKEADAKLQAALTKQRDDLKVAFDAGSVKVIDATNQTAARIQQGAKDQATAIKQQAAQQYERLQGVTRGAKNCPDIGFMDPWPPDTKLPIGFGVSNDDKIANVYDFSAMIVEYGPGADRTTYSSILQQPTFSIPLIVSQHSTFQPFQFQTKTKTISIQITGSTRSNKQCGYHFTMQDEGNNKWVLYSDERSQDSQRTRTLIGKQAVADWYAKQKKSKDVR